MNDHPADVLNFLELLLAHRTDTLPERDREPLEWYCRTHGLTEDTPARGYLDPTGQYRELTTLTVTPQGRFALRHREQAPATTPATPTTPPTPDPTTIVYHGEQSYSAGAEARCVDQQYHDVLQAFMKTPRSMKTKELERVVSNPSKVIGKLREWFPGAVDVPGPDKGKGYTVRVKIAGI